MLSVCLAKPIPNLNCRLFKEGFIVAVVALVVVVVDIVTLFKSL